MIFSKISREGREDNMINTLSKINLSKIGWKGGGSTSIWIMSLNITVFLGGRLPLSFVRIKDRCVNGKIAQSDINNKHKTRATSAKKKDMGHSRELSENGIILSFSDNL